MKKRTAFIGAILSLIPLGQPLLMKTGFAFSTLGVTLFVSENANAESAQSLNKKGCRNMIKVIIMQQYLITVKQ